MARSKGSERGMVRVATAAIVAALGALLGSTGCSSDEGSGGGERLGAVQQHVQSCGGNPCPTDCFNYICGKLNNCVPSLPKPDLSTCSDPQGNQGVCAAQICCIGCAEADANGGYHCRKGVEEDACGWA